MSPLEGLECRTRGMRVRVDGRQVSRELVGQRACALQRGGGRGAFCRLVLLLGCRRERREPSAWSRTSARNSSAIRSTCGTGATSGYRSPNRASRRGKPKSGAHARGTNAVGSAIGDGNSPLRPFDREAVLCERGVERVP